MPIIDISVKNKIATNNCEEKIVCGNEDYVAVFDFDEEWQSYEYKTARFAFNKSVIRVLIEDNKCQIPKLPNTFICGVEIRAGEKYTTTPAWIECLPNLDEEYGEIEPPTPEVYDKIMELLEKAIKANTELPTGGKKGQILKKESDKDYDAEWQDDEALKLIDEHLNDLGWYAKKAKRDKIHTLLADLYVTDELFDTLDGIPSEENDEIIIIINKIEYPVNIVDGYYNGTLNGVIVEIDGHMGTFSIINTNSEPIDISVIQNVYGDVEPIPEKYLPMETLATKEEINSAIGDISTALDELHAYAQNLISGVV